MRGDVVDVYPPYAEHPLRFEFFGDEVELIAEIDEVTGEMLREYEAIPVWPASHYVTEKPKVKAALKSISEECEKRVAELKATDKLLEAQRLQQRTDYDLEMLETMGFCNGIENYSRHLDGRKPGEPPFTLIDYFPKDMLCIIDESHVTVPQIRGMHEGDRSRKVTLVEHGFACPRRSITARFVSMSLRQGYPSLSMFRPRRAITSCGLARTTLSRLFVRPVCSIPRSMCVRFAVRLTILRTRFASALPARSACW